LHDGVVDVLAVLNLGALPVHEQDKGIILTSDTWPR
jgi:hypothetical protein